MRRPLPGARRSLPAARTLAAVTSALALLAPVAGAAELPAVPTLVASVDFGRRVRTHSLVGFLHGLGPAKPPNRLVAPLRPRLWRGSLFSASYDRASRLGARYMVVVSDQWGYPGQGWYGRSAP